MADDIDIATSGSANTSSGSSPASTPDPTTSSLDMPDGSPDSKPDDPASNLDMPDDSPASKPDDPASNNETTKEATEKFDPVKHFLSDKKKEEIGSATLTQEQYGALKKEWREAMKAAHPDKPGGSEELAKQVIEWGLKLNSKNPKNVPDEEKSATSEKSSGTSDSKRGYKENDNSQQNSYDSKNSFRNGNQEQLAQYTNMENGKSNENSILPEGFLAAEKEDDEDEYGDSFIDEIAKNIKDFFKYMNSNTSSIGISNLNSAFLKLVDIAMAQGGPTVKDTLSDIEMDKGPQWRTYPEKPKPGGPATSGDSSAPQPANSSDSTATPANKMITAGGPADMPMPGGGGDLGTLSSSGIKGSGSPTSELSALMSLANRDPSALYNSLSQTANAVPNAPGGPTQADSEAKTSASNFLQETDNPNSSYAEYLNEGNPPVSNVENPGAEGQANDKVDSSKSTLSI